MMPRLTRQLPLLIGAGLVLTFMTLLMRTRYDLEMSRQTVEIQHMLEAVAVALENEIAHGEQRLSAAPAAPRNDKWQRWRLGAAGYESEDGREPPIVAASLRAALAAGARAPHPLLFLGPFGSDRNRDVFTLAERLPEDSSSWRGAWIFSDELMANRAVAELMRGGYRLQLYNPNTATVLFQTSAESIDAPIVRGFRIGSSSYELRAAPRQLPPPFLSSSLLVLLSVGLWMSYELRRGQVLRTADADLRESDARRRDINGLYGVALENIAALESRLHAVSMFDTVTGLGNRSSLIRRIDAALDAMRQSPSTSLSVMAIGFDHVNHITHSFGTEFASRVLIIAAERVEFVLPSKDRLFRTGDFSLALVLTQTDAAASEELAPKILNELDSPIALDSHTFLLRPSIGIASTSTGYEYPETLLDRASAALGAIGRDSPERFCLFDSSATKESVSRLQLEVDLDRAFEDNQFLLEYEPFVAPVTYQVAGFEALIRWNHPTEGRLSPARFVPIAVQAGLSHRLNTWVMREAARQAAAWRRLGYQDFFVNFNLSAEAFLRPNLPDEVGAVLAEFELPGEYLLVELTESTLIQDIRGAARILQRLSELGVGAWLDDFGTGYSSLSHLRMLPLKGVKIDRSFVERVVIDARDSGFLKALIDLIGYLGLQSIAEGIETREQYELLSLTTCDLYQGYHFSRSLSAAEAERWLTEPSRTIKRSIVR
jgi:diguanylate cyclase (GGDEF)-like protein